MNGPQDGSRTLPPCTDKSCRVRPSVETAANTPRPFTWVA